MCVLGTSPINLLFLLMKLNILMMKMNLKYQMIQNDFVTLSQSLLGYMYPNVINMIIVSLTLYHILFRFPGTRAAHDT